MMADIFRIALLCIVFGSVSIPMSFEVNTSPMIVWLGNALGSLISALVVILIANRLTNEKFKSRVRKTRIGRKILKAFDEGEDNKKAAKARGFINKHGLKVFSFLCPIFPGVLLSTVVVYLLDLDKKIYKHWMIAGIFFASGAYVFSYWWVFVR